MGTSSLERELKRGSAELLILALLDERQRHGYEIGRLIADRSDGAISFHVASLYPTLYRLEDKGFLVYSVGPNGIDEGGRWYDDAPPGDDPRVRMPLPGAK